MKGRLQRPYPNDFLNSSSSFRKALSSDLSALNSHSRTSRRDFSETDSRVGAGMAADRFKSRPGESNLTELFSFCPGRPGMTPTDVSSPRARSSKHAPTSGNDI